MICGTVWVVLQKHGDGLVVRESLEVPAHALRQSLCCFVDSNEGITLDTEVEFIGLESR